MKLAVLVASLLTASVSVAQADCSFDSQVHALALNMYYEARGEGPDGMQMVGEVTLTRVEDEAYPDTVCEVVYQRRQFSWTHMKKNHTPAEEELWELSLELAEALLNGDIELFDTGATHFLNPRAVKSLPRWARTYKRVGRVGNHVFYVRS
jgi:spore germination cell wall hydrolase CwlJ-like protein